MDASQQIDSGPGDDELVRQVAAGSETAFAALYDRYAAPVFRAALRLQRDHGVAEDVVQETFLTLWNRAELFDPARGSLGAWLTTIARNRAVDRSRTDARRIPAQSFSVVADGQPDEAGAVEWMLASGNPIAVAAPEPQPDDVVEAGGDAGGRRAGDRRPPRRRAPGDPPRVSRRAHAVGDRGGAGLAAGDREDPFAAGPAPAAPEPDDAGERIGSTVGGLRDLPVGAGRGTRNPFRDGPP